MLLGEVVDQLLDQHGLADAGAAEQPDLAALGVGREQVDHLDPRLEHLGRRRQILDARRVLVDAAALVSFGSSSPRSIGSPSRLKIRPSVASPTGTVIGAPVSITSSAARQAVGRVHRDGAHAVVAEVLLDLADEHALARRPR